MRKTLTVALATAAIIAVSPAGQAEESVTGAQHAETSVATEAQVNLAPISRGEVIERANFWVNQNIPYDMGGSAADPQGTQYRTDCSGFVAMALRAPAPGANTESLPEYLHEITWEELQPGDVVGTLGPGTGGAAGHVVIFNGWANEERTLFNTLEEKGGDVAVAYQREINYTVGDFVAKPYRFNEITD